MYSPILDSILFELSGCKVFFRIFDNEHAVHGAMQSTQFGFDVSSNLKRPISNGHDRYRRMISRIWIRQQYARHAMDAVYHRGEYVYA